MKISCFPGRTAKTLCFQEKHRVFPGWLCKRCFHMIWHHLSRQRTQINQSNHSHNIVAWYDWYDHRLAFLLCYKSLGKTAWSVVMVVRPKIPISLKGWYGTWIEILSNPLRKVRVYFEPMLNPYFTRANPYYLFGLRGIPPLPFLIQYFKIFDHNMKINIGIGIIGGWCWLSMLSSG